MKSTLTPSLFIGFLLASALTVLAAPSSYFSATGVQDMGSTNDWGTNPERDSDTAFELTFDFTTAVDTETNPVHLWEAGGSGTGAALVLNGDNLHFFAGNSNDDVVTGLHGLTAGTTGVQVVAVFDVEGGTGTNESLSIYVNGVDITSGGVDADTAGVWDGGEANSTLGYFLGPGNTERYNGTGLFDTNSVVGYDETGETNISFAVYQLASGGGPADNTLGNILVAVPEVSTVALLGLFGSLVLLRRR
ncbi:hypothetical protein DDZ13_00315 [Coraliomargarita sinensis]|uniref:PEP-CTERM protein-sorting domain-containing protein n=1 Tax=Coraliomargarita sinensis TaxID=2174842 RepID=A0A317ZM80_9BACT|nr:hypothetical protein [Coraliomargarita sinensis]PXA05343.1 hypothetical protein DDZ13_00315 [Coraliomargarita sinensis]